MLSHTNEENEIQRNVKVCTDIAVAESVLFSMIIQLSEIERRRDC